VAVIDGAIALSANTASSQRSRALRSGSTKLENGLPAGGDVSACRGRGARRASASRASASRARNSSVSGAIPSTVGSAPPISTPISPAPSRAAVMRVRPASSCASSAPQAW
jgi:hypothetical protein